MIRLKERLKNSWLSLTMWFNAILATVWVFLPEIASALPAARELLNEEVYRPLMLLAIIGNMILRVKTTQDLAHKDTL